MTHVLRWFAPLALLAACQTTRAAPEPTRAAPEPAPLSKPSPDTSRAAAPARAPARPAKPDTRRYPWVGEAGVPAVVDRLEQRFTPPAGFERVPMPETSFGHWLRGLPLAAADAPVRTYRGDVLHDASDPRIAAVVALDIGKQDLQQCADAVMRLHAEWSWSRGEKRVSYRAAAGMPLPFERWMRGERIRAKGASIAWVPGGAPADDRPAFRKYLDAVFAWANTVSLSKQARPVKPDDVRPGDFFVLPGNPGHTVIVLDVARSKNERIALLGQSFMPAQSFHVLRPNPGEKWFTLDPEKTIPTPFWEPFPWSSLRRLD